MTPSTIQPVRHPWVSMTHCTAGKAMRSPNGALVERMPSARARCRTNHLATTGAP